MAANGGAWDECAVEAHESRSASPSRRRERTAFVRDLKTMVFVVRTFSRGCGDVVSNAAPDGGRSAAEANDSSRPPDAEKCATAGTCG